MTSSVLRPDVHAWRESSLKSVEHTFELPTGGGGGNNGGMDSRIDRLEAEMKEVRSDLRTLLVDSTEIKVILKQVATRADVEVAKSALVERMAGVEGQARHMLTFWQFLIVMAAFLGLVMRWPDLFRLAGFVSGNP